ncbi:hypothetical protein KD050_19545 [Psychrobacillus sp. INOP01]|uniref:hypothetical protein n=1 Tax=Psychrobacillus sp. INOP01 TaxID=2829187 RepID=UPI001BA996DC|nr:hypothetical protein [Psychrobacillus sp. INOP01]QUG41442.1 hypothetical protein KD050_19545 [Psychrobacillus sp. INOP01]
MNALFENEEDSSFLNADNNTSLVNVIESYEENDSSSFALGTDSASDFSLGSQDGENEVHAKVMTQLSAWIEAENTEDTSHFWIEVETESIFGHESEEENSISSMLNGTVGLWGKSRQNEDSEHYSSKLGLDLDLGLTALSESVNE